MEDAKKRLHLPFNFRMEQRGITRFAAKDPASTSSTSLEEYYRARIVNTSVFNP